MGFQLVYGFSQTPNPLIESSLLLSHLKISIELTHSCFLFAVKRSVMLNCAGKTCESATSFTCRTTRRSLLTFFFWNHRSRKASVISKPVISTERRVLSVARSLEDSRRSSRASPRANSSVNLRSTCQRRRFTASTAQLFIPQESAFQFLPTICCWGRAAWRYVAI